MRNRRDLAKFSAIGHAIQANDGGDEKNQNFREVSGDLDEA